MIPSLINLGGGKYKIAYKDFLLLFDKLILAKVRMDSQCDVTS
jgi:hypothetical protein